MVRSKKMRIVDVSIEDYSHDGFGLAFIEQQNGSRVNVEVPFTMPGDEARVVLLKKRKGAYTSLPQELIKQSPLRITPRCIHFGTCGGCRWQEVPYEHQLKQKEATVRRLFAPYLTPLVNLHPILPCNPPWNYRNKMELSFSNNKAKDRFLGLIMHAGRGRVFNMTECHLASPWIIDAINAVNLWWVESGLDAYHPPSNNGSLRTLTLRDGKKSGDRMVMLTVSGNPEFALHRSQLNSLVTFLRDAIEPSDANQRLSIFLRIQQIAKGSPTNFYEMLLYGPDHIREILTIDNGTENEEASSRDLTFHISPTAFFQPNSQQAEKLYSHALILAQIPKDGIVYDLYCGTGTLGICAARHAKHVIGIELSRESALDARENIKINGINNMTIYEGDVGIILEKFKNEGTSALADVVLVDPPRAGLDPKALKQLIDLHPHKIVYISCNPATQAENVGVLVKAGYQLKTLQPVDQFPHTIHIENIAVLERNFA